MATALLFAAGCSMGEESNGDGNGKTDSAAMGYLVEVRSTTTFKISPVHGDELEWGSEKCSLIEGIQYYSAMAPVYDGDYVILDIEGQLPGCEFSIGFAAADALILSDELVEIPADSIGKVTEGSGPGGCHADISVRECAFLATIASAEGTNENYNIMYSFKTFSSYDDHPRQKICSGNWCSTAAGRYQILEKTWDEYRRDVGVTDFTPASQDLFGLFLAANRGVRNIDSIDTKKELSDALYKCNREWASLPGSPYGQPTHSVDTLWLKYKKFAGL